MSQPKLQLEFKVEFDSKTNNLSVTHTCGVNARKENTIRLVLDMKNDQDQVLFLASVANADVMPYASAVKDIISKTKLGMLSLDASQIPTGSFLAISHAVVDYARSVQRQWENLAA